MTTTYVPFVPSNEWQEVPLGSILPNGCVIRMNPNGEKRYATWDRGAATPPFILHEAPHSEARPDFSLLSPLDIATYMRDVQGQRPVPDCDPQHLYVSAGHRDGYIDRQGRKHPGCKSPGKAPLVTQWQRFSSQSPTDAELRSMFALHKGNVGNVVINGRVVLDVDKRSGGLSSIKLLQDVHEALPETPTQRTGGGGFHYHFLWPDGVVLPTASGSLAALGYPGVEWKGPTQQVVVAPSTYPGTGAAYEWVEGAALEDIDVAPIPEWLLALILQVNQFPRTRKATELNPLSVGAQSDRRRPTLTHAEIVMAFRQIYMEGSRRAGTGLPRLIGILKGHGVDVDMAVRFLRWWQPDHVVPPLSDAELEDTIRNMYERYKRNETTGEARKVGGGANPNVQGLGGAQSPTHPGRGHTFLIRLAKDLLGKTGVRTDKAFFIAPTGEAITQDAAADLTRRAIAEMRNDALFSQRRRPENAQLGTTQSSSTQLGILVADRRFLLSKDEMLDRLAYAEGPTSKVVEKVEHCLWDGAMHCWEHGDRYDTKCMCRLFCHYDCIHRSTLKVRQLQIADIPKEKGAYLYVRFQWKEPVYLEEGHTLIYPNDERVDFGDKVRKLGKRKTLKGTFLAHSLGFLLGRPDTIVEGRLLFRLDGQDRSQFDKAVRLLCTRLGAKITGERVYQEGESVVVQLMEDSMSSFLGMMDKTDDELFAAWYWEIKGKPLFQGLNELYRMLQDIKLEEPALCDVCGKKLRLRPISPEETLKKKAEPPTAPSPAPSPPPKQARLAV